MWKESSIFFDINILSRQNLIRIIGSASLFLSSCGITHAGNPGTVAGGSGDKPKIEKIIDDDQVADNIVSQLSNSLSLISDSTAGSDEKAALVASLESRNGSDQVLARKESERESVSYGLEPVLERKCSRNEENKSITVDNILEGQKNIVSDKRNSRTGVFTFKYHGIDVIFGLGTKVDCNLRMTGPRYAKIETLDGLELQSRVSNVKTLNAKYKVKNRKGELVETRVEKSDDLQGNTKILLTNFAKKADGWQVTQTISSNYTHVFELIVNGISKGKKDSSAVISPNSPMIAEVTRKGRDDGWDSKLIKSGSIDVKSFSGETIQLNFTDVLYLADDKCSPKSGKIVGTFTTSTNDKIGFKVETSQETGNSSVTFDGLQPIESTIDLCIK